MPGGGDGYSLFVFYAPLKMLEFPALKKNGRFAIKHEEIQPNVPNGKRIMLDVFHDWMNIWHSHWLLSATLVDDMKGSGMGSASVIAGGDSACTVINNTTQNGLKYVHNENRDMTGGKEMYD